MRLENSVYPLAGGSSGGIGKDLGAHGARPACCELLGGIGNAAISEALVERGKDVGIADKVDVEGVGDGFAREVVFGRDRGRR